MKKLILPALLLLVCLFNTTIYADTVTDTTKKNHIVDGDISEWKLEKFEMDKATQVLYSADNDAGNLYVAMKITDQHTQMKMMMQGMSMFIDKKGKKKEGTGIEFPVKKERPEGYAAAGQDEKNGLTAKQHGPPQPDLRAIHERMATNMILLKTFGFEEEDKMQLIAQPNGINVAFGWDDANDMYIEYGIPLSLLDKPAELNGKPMGIGWKIYAAGKPANTSAETGSFSRGVGGRGGGGPGRPGGNSVDFSAAESRFKEQNIWTRYTIRF